MNKPTFFAFLLLFLLTTQLFAQQYGNFKKVPLAVGFFPPLNTNGKQAGDCVNQVSLNLFVGYSAGLSGVECSLFTNTERDFVHGIQIAGFGNFVAGDFTGFQFANFANFNKGVSNGFQFAGFSNFNYNQADGVLAAGFFNFTKGKSLALQFAGFANFCEDAQGVQAAGFANVVKGNGKVTQLAGFTNIIEGEVNGIQIAGFANYSKKKMQKVQMAGFMNISNNDVNGTQVAGFANIAKGNVNGVQISGYLNIAKNLTGVQIGIVNIADSLKSGIPIGLLSIAKNGFHEFEFSASEGFNAQATYKTGIDQFYNIFTVGAQVFGPKYSWGLGYGIGTHLSKTEQFKTQLEWIEYHINEGEVWTKQQNTLDQLKLSFTRKINNHVSIFAGPTANLMISKTKDHDGNAFKSCFAPYDLVSHHGDKKMLQGWIGFTAGIHLN